MIQRFIFDLINRFKKTINFCWHFTYITTSSPHRMSQAVPILQEGMTFSSPPSCLMWDFPPSAPTVPLLGDILEPPDTMLRPHPGLTKLHLAVDWILLGLQKKLIPDTHAYAQDKKRECPKGLHS